MTITADFFFSDGFLLEHSQMQRRMKTTGLRNTHCKAMAGIERLTVRCNTALLSQKTMVTTWFLWLKMWLT
jgi:hypothetical protein